jgi:hypothetical protein
MLRQSLAGAQTEGAGMILYVGPDQLIPLSGFFGTAVGLVLLFWGRVVNGCRRLVQMFSSNSSKTAQEKTGF